MPTKRAKPGTSANPKAPKYRGDYHVRSRRITKAARENPTTRCWRPDCGLTLAEARAKWGRHVIWHAGHVETNGRLLLPECSHCNIADRNQRMRGKPRSKSQARTVTTPNPRRTASTNLRW